MPSAVKSFDRDYFSRYVDSGKPYGKVFLRYSGVSECVELFRQEDAPRLKKVGVLGAATGKVLAYLARKLKVVLTGCEISEWAHGKIPKNYRQKIVCQDMRTWVPRMEKVDLIFSNSLMYLEEKDIATLLKKARKKTDYFYFEGSFRGNACRDPHRKTLRTEAWWEKEFSRAGFERLSSPWKKIYLWK